MRRFNFLPPRLFEGARFLGRSQVLAFADVPSTVQNRRPRYRPPTYEPAWIDPVWQSRAVLESAGAERRLEGAETWIYQLQRIDSKAIAASEADVAVIDYTPNGGDTPPFTREQVEAMRRKKSGRKKIISYMSIGQAEEWRFYWRKEWLVSHGETRRPSKSFPRWIAGEDTAWNSFWVKYWDPDWQEIILGQGNSYLNQIINAGFDGVYLDIINGYDKFTREGRKSAATEMIQFVGAIAKAARRQNPNFLVVPQNGEQLLKDTTYCSFISAIGKEDILFTNSEGVPNDENSYVAPQPKNDSKDVEGYLEHAKRHGIPVLSIEYLHSVKPENAKEIPVTAAKLRRLGYVPYFGNRLLNTVYEPVAAAPVAMS